MQFLQCNLEIEKYQDVWLFERDLLKMYNSLLDKYVGSYCKSVFVFVNVEVGKVVLCCYVWFLQCNLESVRYILRCQVN